MKLRTLLLAFVFLYAAERSEPWISLKWPRWKRAIYFNPFMDKLFDLVCTILKSR